MPRHARAANAFLARSAPRLSWVLGRLVWLCLKPSNLLLLVALVGLVAAWRGRRSGLVLLTAVLACMTVVVVLPVGAWLMAPLEDRFPPPAAYPAELDGIIVLGGGVQGNLAVARGQPTFDDPAERYLALVELARRYPDTRLVFTGGSGLGSGGLAEADIIAMLADRHGLAPDRVTLERHARNTRENAVLSRELVSPKPGERWLLVTSAGHMPRSVGVFRNIGWRVIPWPVDYRSEGPWQSGSAWWLARGLTALDDAAYEWIGLAYYRLLGHIDNLFPAPGDQD